MKRIISTAAKQGGFTMISRGWVVQFELEVQYSLDMFNHYADFLEERLQQEGENQLETLEFIEDEEARQEFAEQYQYELTRYTEEFLNTLRSSLLASIYAFAESRLVSICNSEANRNGKKFDKNKGSNTIFSVKEYLEVESQMDFSSSQVEWDFLNDIRRLRNNFMHGGGEVGEFNTNLQTIIFRTEGVSIGSSNEMLLSKELNRKLTESVHIILKSIYKQLYGKDES